mgnify:CR=1 FL=1
MLRRRLSRATRSPAGRVARTHSAPPPSKSGFAAIRGRIARFLSAREGATAVEFALIAMPFLGLVAAIPAVIIYNHFSRDIKVYLELVARASGAAGSGALQAVDDRGADAFGCGRHGQHHRAGPGDRGADLTALARRRGRGSGTVQPFMNPALRPPLLSTLPNGLRVVALPMPWRQTVSLSVYLRTGSLHEPARLAGISHVVEHMAFKGTATRDCQRINLDAERLGAELNAHTDKDHTAFHIDGLAADQALWPWPADTGFAALWTNTMVWFSHPTQRYYRAAGSLGWSFPASLGGKCGAPDKPVFCFTGDGGFYHWCRLPGDLNVERIVAGFEHQGDNRTGAGEGDDEQIKVTLSKLPADVDKVVLGVTIHDAEARRQNFGMVSKAFIRCLNAEGEKEIARYDLSEDSSTETAMIFGEIYRYNGEWKFKQRVIVADMPSADRKSYAEPNSTDG